MSQLPSSPVRFLLSLSLIILMGGHNHRGQAVADIPATSQPSISDVSTEVYESIDGLFRIQLPSPPGGLMWKFREGEIRMGYFDYGWKKKRASSQTFDVTADQFDRDTLAKFSGKISEKKPTSRTDPFRSKTYFSFEREGFGIQLHVMNKNRYYTALAVFPSLFDQQKFEAVIDSFSVVHDPDIESIMQKRIGDRTLSALPQNPVAKGENTDWIDEKLKGQVAKIIEEVEELHDNSSRTAGDDRPITKLTEYDRRGYVLRSIQAGGYGTPDDVEVWGFIDGKRVSKRGFSFDRYNLFEPVIGQPLIEGPNVPHPSLGYDPRYYLSYKKNYRSGKLVEVLWFDNSGKANLRRSLAYGPKTVTVTVYGGAGDFRFKTVSKTNKDGLPLDEIYFSPPHHNSLPSKTVFAYTYDSQGNWIKKTVSIERLEQGRAVLYPQYAIHRIITYF